MEREDIISNEERSDCCDAPIWGEIVDGIGICSFCKEWCGVMEDEDDTEAEEEKVVG